MLWSVEYNMNTQNSELTIIIVHRYWADKGLEVGARHFNNLGLVGDRLASSPTKTNTFRIIMYLHHTYTFHNYTFRHYWYMELSDLLKLIYLLSIN
jgi:hypothetical protein